MTRYGSPRTPGHTTRGLVVAAVAVVLQLASAARADTVAIVGGTVVDVSDFGRSTNDIADAVVLIDGDAIVGVGPASLVKVPPAARTIDARGKFLAPGLIDGFGAMRSQGFASAYLYDGVTTVYVPQRVAGGGDGETKPPYAASPGPRVFLGGPVAGYSMTGADPSDKPMTAHRLHDQRLSHPQLVARVEQLARRGFRGIEIGRDVWPDQLDVIVAAAKRRGLAIRFEMGFTSYPYAIRAGVDALVRNDRYQAQLAPAADQLAYVDDRQHQGMAVSRAVCAAEPSSSAAAEYGAQLSTSRTALMPALALEATADSLDVPNPWTAASAVVIDAADLDEPVDRVTGESAYLAGMTIERRDRVRRCARRKAAMDARLHELGARYLAGSASPAYGIMPGSGLHLELALLGRAGLTPREALAAATSNYADVYGWPDVGRIERGRRADILILDADPRIEVTAIDHIHALVARGALVDRGALLERAPPRGHRASGAR